MLLDSVLPEKWYSVSEVSEVLGFQRDTVIRQIKAGFLKAFILPRKPTRKRVFCSYRIQGAEIIRYVREHVR